MTMRGHRRTAECHGERGFIIVPVLWILLTLASLAGILAVYLANTAIALSINDDRLRSVALVSASLELTAYDLSLSTKPLRPPIGSFSFRLDHALVSVAFSSETTRIDLNLASKEMLANLFAALGAEPRDAAGPTNHTVRGQQIAFEPLPKLAAKADALYRVKVKTTRSGDWRFKVEMTSGELDSPVHEEESTRVYGD